MKFCYLLALLLAVFPSIAQESTRASSEEVNPRVVVDSNVPVEVSMLKYKLAGNRIEVSSIEVKNKAQVPLTAFQVIWDVYAGADNVQPARMTIQADHDYVAPGESRRVEGLTASATSESSIKRISGKLAYVRFADGKQFGTKQ